MNVTPNEAEESLAAIQTMAQKTRHSIAGSGVSINLIITGVIWLIGYTCTQFLSGQIVATIWIALSLLGSLIATILGVRLGRRVRSPATGGAVKRVTVFWLALILFCLAVIAVARPTDGKQLSLIIVLFIMIGQWSMGLLFSFEATWWALPIAALALAGYYLMPEYFYLWMAILGGGAMITVGLYIRWRW